MAYCVSKSPILLDKFLLLLSSSEYSLLNEFNSVLFLYVVCLYAFMCVDFIVEILIFLAWPWPLFFLLDKFIYSFLISHNYTLHYVTIWQVRKWFTRIMKLLLKRAKGIILHAIIITHTLLLLQIFHYRFNCINVDSLTDMETCLGITITTMYLAAPAPF